MDGVAALLESVLASFTRVGAGAAALLAGVGAAAVLAGAEVGLEVLAAGLEGTAPVVVLEAPPLVEGAVGVGVPVSIGAAVVGAVAPLSERGIGWFSGTGPFVVGVSSVMPLPPLDGAGGWPISVALTLRTSSTALVCGGSTIGGSPTFAAADVSGWCFMNPITWPFFV